MNETVVLVVGVVVFALTVWGSVSIPGQVLPSTDGPPRQGAGSR